MKYNESEDLTGFKQLREEVGGGLKDIFWSQTVLIFVECEIDSDLHEDNLQLAHNKRKRHQFLLSTGNILYPNSQRFVMSRQASLEKELEQATKLNSMVDSLLATVRKTQHNISSTKTATDSTSALLEDWIKILNQTRFATNALQDPLWEGPKDDENDGNGEQVLVQEAQLELELRALESENNSLKVKLDTQLSLPERDSKRVKR